jgi:ABC-type dipeptide/oligopeptide/nickel transport system permease component
LPNSLELALAATLLSFFIGIPAGIVSAVRVNSGWDSFGKIVALLGLSIPGFWLGLVLILVFSVWLHWLPTSGQGGWQHLIMPALALGWYFAASLLRLTRSSMLEVLRSEYVKLARLKGLPGYVVLGMHAFKNALIPVLTLAGVNLVVMINAAVIIEVIFAWPGIGRLLYEGIFQRDFPLVQGIVMEAGIMIVVINLIIDLLYAYIDPRIRLTK